MHKRNSCYSRSAPDILGLIRLCRTDIGKDLETSMPAENLHLPRAIKFTGALYSIGLPPEFIGTGLALEEASKKLDEVSCERLLAKYIPYLESDLSFASGYIDLNEVSRFLSEACSEKVCKDIEILRDFLSLKTKPEPSYSILLEIMQSVLLQAGIAGNSLMKKSHGSYARLLSKWGK